MLKKTITYTDYDGNQRTEDFYFNLSEDELIEMSFSKKGGLDSFIERIVKEQDSQEIIRMFKELVAKAYGKKSDDGRRFDKSEEILKDFTSTKAYTKVFMELAFNSDAAADFINRVIPSDVAAKIAEYRDAKKTIEQ